MIDLTMTNDKLYLCENGSQVMEFDSYNDALDLFDKEIEKPSRFIAGGIDCRQGLTQMSDDDDYVRGYAAAYALQEVIGAMTA